MKEQSCSHCQTPFTPTTHEPKFCCAGCRFVNQLLVGEGLENFYQLQGNQSGRPVGDRPFEKPSTEWLKLLISKLSEDEVHHSLRIRISGVTCIGCVWLIERLFMAQDGAVRASVFPATAEAEFTWEKGSLTMEKLANELPRYGYLLEDLANVRRKTSESKKLIPRLGLCTAFAINTMAFALPRYLGMSITFTYAGLFDLIALLSATFALLLGGSYFFTKALAAIRHRSIHIDLPIALGITAAYLGSLIGWFSGEADLIYFDFVAIFTTLMLGGRYLHLASAERAQSQLQGESAIPDEISLTDGTPKSVQAISSGDQLIIPPGQALPVASRLLSETSDFSLAWMTGEPDPKTILQGAPIPAGAIPISKDSIIIIATETYPDSLISRLTREETHQDFSKKVQRILKYYLLSIIVLGIGGGYTWLLLGAPPIKALQVMISIFVVSCPCAIGVAIPLVDRRASSALARLGVFIQNPNIWQHLTRIRHLIFDKTGTLTLENPALIDPPKLTSEARSIVHTLTADSLHPLSRSLYHHLSTAEDIAAPSTDHPGLGVSLIYQENIWSLGKPGWLGQDNFTTTATKQLACELSCNGTSVAIFYFRESLRPKALHALSCLTKSHYLHILSGDQKSRVHELATTLGIPDCQAHGNLSPEEKEKMVTALSPSLYLGDGMNDTLAFNSSTITGTPVADRSLLDRRADFLFTCPGLSFLPTLFSLAKWRHQTVTLILIFTTTYNFVAITACILGYMTPLAAAILMPVSSILSLLIASRNNNVIRK